MGKRIAILCMSLNIGGAETHIFELAKGLHDRGHEVTVFSNGGVYAEALEKAGIRHVKAPLNTKSPGALLRSYRILSKEFRARRPSVVHSHTRISNFVGGLVCRRLRLPLVTTVHFNFRVGAFSRILSRWGIRALAVSEDLKKYLVENYSYDPARVEITVNGIDMERFCKKDAREFRRSLGVEDGQKMLLMVSRLDKEASIHVSRFLDIAPAIYEHAPETRVVIVGDGKLFPDFVRRANEINRACGVGFIRLEGAKTNIDSYTAAADLFVGISRSALEAMSSEVPVILLGNMGYLGLYSSAIRAECIETNLTCRGYPYPAEEALIGLITDCLKGKDLRQNAADGKELVKECYSVATMAATAEKQYRAAIEDLRPMDYMISGYYGRDNFGDNLTLRCLMDHLQNRRGSVLTCNTEKTRVPETVRKIHRFRLMKIARMMKKTKVFLLGSGSILQDSTSSRSLFYYRFIIRMAVRYHCAIQLFANGIGPITRPGNLRKTKRILQKADLITVRDDDSLRFLKEIGVPCPVYLTADDAFSYPLPPQNDLPPDENAAGRTLVGVNLKLNPKTENAKIRAVAEALRELSEKHNYYYYLIPFHFTQDMPSLKKLRAEIPALCRLIEPSPEPEVLLGFIAACRYQIFERLHGQIMATKLGTPFLSVHYDPKNRSFACQTGTEDHLIKHADLDREHLVRAFEDLLRDEENVRAKLRRYAAKAAERAEENKAYLYKMIEEY